MTDFPTTSGDLLHSPSCGKDDFYLLGRVQQSSDAQSAYLHIAPDMPLAVDRKELFQHVPLVPLPTRQSINDGAYADIDGLRLVGAGIFLTVKDSEGERRIPVLQRNGNVSNTGKWTNPAVLCERLVRKNPAYAAYRFISEPLSIHAHILPNRTSRHVEVDFMDKKLHAASYLFPSDDKVHSSFNIDLAAELTLPQGLRVRDIELVDPEPFNRQTCMATRQQLEAMDKTPALNRYVATSQEAEKAAPLCIAY